MSQTLIEEVRSRLPLPAPRAARLIREEAGVTQVRFAAELGVDRMTIGRWENGTRRPQGANRDAYARLLAELREAVK